MSPDFLTAKGVFKFGTRISEADGLALFQFQTRTESVLNLCKRRLVERFMALQRRAVITLSISGIAILLRLSLLLRGFDLGQSSRHHSWTPLLRLRKHSKDFTDCRRNTQKCGNLARPVCLCYARCTDGAEERARRVLISFLSEGWGVKPPPAIPSDSVRCNFR